MKTDFRGLIKPGNHGIDVQDGIEYVKTYSFKTVVLLRIVKFIQKTLWLCGIAIYDPIFGECTPDFNCCTKIGRKAWIRFHYKATK